MTVSATIQTRSSSWPWLMLPARLVLFAFFQLCVAILLVLFRSDATWQSSAAWWPLTAFLANLVCIGLLQQLYRREGLRYLDIFRIQRATVKKDLLVLLGTLVIAGPVAFLPNILSATWLFGEQEVALDLMMQPLPLWGFVMGLILFPVTVALAELPTYFAYCMPRLEAQTGRRWLAVLLASFFLALQHCTLPLIFDGRFLAWRPQLLPYLVVVHGLMDMAAVAMIPIAG